MTTDDANKLIRVEDFAQGTEIAPDIAIKLHHALDVGGREPTDKEVQDLFHWVKVSRARNEMINLVLKGVFRFSLLPNGEIAMSHLDTNKLFETLMEALKKRGGDRDDNR